MGPENVEHTGSDDSGPEASASSSPRIHVRSSSPDVENGQFPLPVWLRESSQSFHWRWVPYRIRSIARSVATWSKGPDPPQIQKITPFFPDHQTFAVELIRKHLPKKWHKVALLGIFYFCWILTFSLVLQHSASAGNIEGYGKPEPLWCGASFWLVKLVQIPNSLAHITRSAKNGCDLNGNGCRPFNNATFAFRCPADCLRVKVLNPHAVGDQEINYKPFVIGGLEFPAHSSSKSQPIYRADSFICQAAIHDGIVSDKKGGCGVASLIGEQRSYKASRQNGISSIGFDSSFPKSYTFLFGLSSECIQDLRWPLLAVTVTFTTLLSLATDSSFVFFGSIFPMLFFHVGLVSDPPNNSALPSLTSLIIGRFLPAALASTIIYHYSVRPQMAGLTAHVEKTVLWLGGAWVGCLNNYTFYFIPLERLTPHDIQVQPGAQVALSLVILLLLSIAAGQIYYLRLEGRLPRYLAIYGIFVTFLLVCVIIPPLNLRIHHYFLALLLLPGTRLQTRPSLLYQGILVGLFINGTARWGFDSILQTTAALRADGQFNSLLPNITNPIAIGVSNITFAWAAPPKGYDGLSVLVNDVERHRWYVGEGAGQQTFFRAWDGQKEYFRFGFMSGSSAADYTQAVVWSGDGHWTEMKKGPS